MVVLGQQLYLLYFGQFYSLVQVPFLHLMRASGTVTVPMLINISAILFIEIPCAYWFSSMWGLKGIWVAYALAFVSLCIIQGLYYQRYLEEKTIKVLI